MTSYDDVDATALMIFLEMPCTADFKLPEQFAVILVPDLPPPVQNVLVRGGGSKTHNPVMENE